MAQDSAAKEQGLLPEPPFQPLLNEYIKLVESGWPVLLVVAPLSKEDVGATLGNARNGQEILLLLSQAALWAESFAKYHKDEKMEEMILPIRKEIEILANVRLKMTEKSLGELVPSLGQKSH